MLLNQKFVPLLYRALFKFKCLSKFCTIINWSLTWLLKLLTSHLHLISSTILRLQYSMFQGLFVCAAHYKRPHNFECMWFPAAGITQTPCETRFSSHLPQMYCPKTKEKIKSGRPDVCNSRAMLSVVFLNQTMSFV